MPMNTVETTGRRVDTDTLLDRVDLAAVATNLLGPPPGRRGQHGRRLWWCCPFHADKNPSLAVDPGKRWWRCYGCDARGTAIDLLTRLEGLGFLDTCRKLADGAGLAPEAVGMAPSPGSRGSTPRPAPPDSLSQFPGGRENRDRDTETSPRGMGADDARALVERAAADLWKAEYAQGLAYLRRRGFRDDTIRAARLGWTDWLSIPRADGSTFRSRGLVIPWYDGPRLAKVKLRPPEGEGGPKYAEAFRDNPTLYTAVSIRSGRPMVVCEGELDALTVGQEAGEWVGVVTLGSASERLSPATLATLAVASPWIIALDRDGAGEKASA